jgi:hypothetical protein
VAKVQPAVVGVSIGPAQGSGVIVKGGRVLTAGHVSGQPGRTVTLHLADGRKLKGKTLGRNADIDSGLIEITDKGDWPGVEMGKSADLKKGQWVVAIGHPGGYRANRTPVVRLGRVLEVNAGAIVTDCPLVGGDSGGPLFDLDGKIIGIHSRIGGPIMANLHVPVGTYVDTWDRLARGETWGGMAGLSLVQSPGGNVVFEKKDRLTAEDPRDEVQKSCQRKVYTLRMSPASIYTIDLASKKMDSFLRLEDSTGKQLASDHDGAGHLDARIVFRPDKEDTYRIIATTFKPDQTGPFTLTVRQLDAKDVMVRGEVKVFAALKIPRFAAPLLLRQLASVQGPLSVRGTVFDAAGKPVADKEIQFQWDGDKTTLKTNDQGVVLYKLSLGRGRGKGKPRDLTKDLVLRVPEGDEALVELTGANGKFRLFKFSPDGKGKAPTPPGMIVLQAEGKITADDPMDKVRTRCRHKVHTFKVAAGATYTIDLESTDFDAFLRIENSAGKQLAKDDDSGGDFNARVELHPKEDDTLRIIVTTCDPGQLGAYRLTIRQAEKK